MDVKRKQFYKTVSIVLPPLLFIIVVYSLPIHTSIMLLMVPFIPIVLILDACFYTAPFILFLFVCWLLFAFAVAFFPKKRHLISKTRLLPVIFISVLLLGYASTKVTTFLIDADLPRIGLF